MAGKDTITPIPVVTNGDMSGSFVGLPVKVQGFDNLGFQIVYTGVPVGEFVFDVSQNQVTWSRLPDELFAPVGPIMAMGVGDDIFVDLNQMGGAWVRLSYIRTSGTGTANAQFTAKLI